MLAKHRDIFSHTRIAIKSMAKAMFEIPPHCSNMQKSMAKATYCLARGKLKNSGPSPDSNPRFTDWQAALHLSSIISPKVEFLAELGKKRNTDGDFLPLRK